jgi:hypothetical protein
MNGRIATLLVSMTVALAVGGVGHPVAAAPSGAGCELEGTFRPTPSLKTGSVRMHYTIVGRANDCHWIDGTTESGTFTARGSGMASCTEGTTRGVAHIAWDDHRTSTMTYTTTNLYNAVELEGTFVKGASKGYAARGLLFFVVDQNEPVGCLTEFGLNKATFYGFCERGKLE